MNHCDVKYRMTLHCSLFDVKMVLMHCVSSEFIWWRVTLVFVLRLNPLHVSSCEVVAWLAHLWWRLSCLSQRFSYVTSDAWSRNVIRLCGITVCVSGNSFILLYRDFDIRYLIIERSLAIHSYTSYWYLLEVVPGCLHAATQLRNWMSYQAGFHIKWWIPVMIPCSIDDKPSR